jgi:hypothetical protein
MSHALCASTACNMDSFLVKIVLTVLKNKTDLYLCMIWNTLNTVAVRSKAWTVFARSNAGIVDSNPTRGMDVCVSLFCVLLFCL